LFVQRRTFASIRRSWLRTATDVRQVLQGARNRGIRLEIVASLRALDGPGSSLDLEDFQLALTPPAPTSLSDIPSTPTFASDRQLRLTFDLAENPAAIEYVSPDYGLPAGAPDVTVGCVVLTPDGRAPRGQRDAPAYIFGNVFGLSGIRVEVHSVPVLGLTGGLESSSVFDLALMLAASILSGADLSLADVVAAAVQVDSERLDGPTGAQGHLAALLGGAFCHVWLRRIASALNRRATFAVLSVPLVYPEQYSFYEERMALLQAGKVYLNGTPVIERTASLTESIWLDLLRDRDPVGLALHGRKPAVAASYIAALRTGEIQAVISAVNEYVDIRDQLVRRWMALSLTDSRELPRYVDRYRRRLSQDELLQRYHDIYGDDLLNTSLYTQGLEPGSAYDGRHLIREARARGLGLMPLGAGGPGATMLAVACTPEELHAFLERVEIPPLHEETARRTIRGSGTVRGYLPLRIGTAPIQVRGFQELGLRLPAAAREVSYDAAAGDSILNLRRLLFESKSALSASGY
jgi:hypothetical protein